MLRRAGLDGAGVNHLAGESSGRQAPTSFLSAASRRVRPSSSGVCSGSLDPVALIGRLPPCLAAGRIRPFRCLSRRAVASASLTCDAPGFMLRRAGLDRRRSEPPGGRMGRRTCPPPLCPAAGPASCLGEARPDAAAVAAPCPSRLPRAHTGYASRGLPPYGGGAGVARYDRPPRLRRRFPRMGIDGRVSRVKGLRRRLSASVSIGALKKRRGVLCASSRFSRRSSL